MRPTKTPWFLDPDNFVIVLPIGFLVVVSLITIVSFHMESATFNRLTGAHTTWWDAVWVELRVQEEPK